jgi:hypothetical protein
MASHERVPMTVVILRESGVSSTPRLLGSSLASLEYWVPAFAGTTVESVASRHCEPTGRRECRQLVIAGLDPAIQLLRKNFLRRWMDARIKSGHDEPRARTNDGRHTPRKRSIQYAAASRFIAGVSGILDRPPSRATTVESVASRHCEPTGRRECRQLVIAGLDPAIHLLRKNFLRRWMDARIKSGHDECVLCAHQS